MQSPFAANVPREVLLRSLTGTAAAGATLAATLVALFLLRKRILALLHRFNDAKLFTFALTALTVLSLPDPAFPLRPGLDYSWQWTLNQLALGRAWGESIVFTYGPLGWLLCPTGRWDTVLLALAANTCFCILWIWSVRKIYLSSENGRVAAWGLVITMFFPQMTMEWRWIALSIIMVRTSWLAAGAISAVLALMKFSSLIMAAGTQLFMLVLAADRRRRFLNYAVGLAMTFTLLSAVTFHSPNALFMWLTGSAQIAIGYNRHMLVDKGFLELALPIAAFAVLVHKPRHILSLLPLAPFLYCVAKYSWVRQGIGPFLYALTIAAALLAERFASDRRRFLLTAAMFVLIGYGLTWPRFFAANQTYVAFPFGVNPTGTLRTLILPHAVKRIESVSMASLARNKLPPRIRAAIGDATVQLLPHEFAPAMADPSLRIVPYATMQMYSTYTAQLDKLAARSYSSAEAPEFIVIDTDNLSIDGKNAFLDCPRTWNAIHENYSLLDTSDEGRWILLKRRAAPIPTVCDRRINIPDETLAEKLIAILFRGKLHYADIETPKGTMKHVRINPSVLKDPIDRDLPFAANELAEYMRHTP
ncbi:MAG: hypothetical protein IKF72_05710 [Kiritimatiellae bacterium]|nr:hypothetical protein [Kiritimatiellia bacterium]